MFMMSRVCAEFHDHLGNVIHRITPANRLLFHDAPDEIRDDLLFRLLLQDGSIQATESDAEIRALENEPMAGAFADGKSVVSSKPARNTRKAKAEEKPETKPDGEATSAEGEQ